MAGAWGPVTLVGVCATIFIGTWYTLQDTDKIAKTRAEENLLKQERRQEAARREWQSSESIAQAYQMSVDSVMHGLTYQFTVLASIAIKVFFVYLYRTKIVDQCKVLQPRADPDPLSQDDTVGREESGKWPRLFACFYKGKRSYILYIMCCGWPRVAHTWYAAGVLPTFWQGLALIWLITAAPSLGVVYCGLNSMFQCITYTWCCFTVHYRIKIKERLGEKVHWEHDCLESWMCAPCALAQEAIAVDEELGMEVECCFKVQQRDKLS